MGSPRLMAGLPPKTQPVSRSSRRTRPRAQASCLFWLSVGLLFYVYAGYPVIAGVRARIRPRPVARAVERRGIPATIPFPDRRADDLSTTFRSSLSPTTKHPPSKPGSRTCWRWTTRPDRLEIIVGSDGSTDDTVDRARRYQPFGVRVQSFQPPQRQASGAQCARAARLWRHRAVCRCAAAVRAVHASRHRCELQRSVGRRGERRADARSG